MRSLIGLVAALACAAAVLHAQNTLVFFASVVDAAGAPVPALNPGDLIVAENGTEGKIVKVEPMNS